MFEKLFDRIISSIEVSDEENNILDEYNSFSIEEFERLMDKHPLTIEKLG